VLDVANKAPIIKLVNTILFQALKMRASDAHFHPYQDRMQVRFRIDGILYDMDPIPRKAQDAIISRIKIMGKMDIAERRLPQDGRATIRIGDGEVDVRISSIPTTNGERSALLRSSGEGLHAGRDRPDAQPRDAARVPELQDHRSPDRRARARRRPLCRDERGRHHARER
jgi:type II secretory ATPase GspE/PulE/Tfp pilus assembly ATPase PilB-like protein